MKIEGNNGPVQMVTDSPNKHVWVATLVISIIALVMAVSLFVVVLNIRDDIRDAKEAMVGAAVSAERADKAERHAAISELYAKQVFVELNRLGYPVKTPAEEHSVAPPNK